MTHQAIATSGAPAAIGPYSQGIATTDLVFCSGQLGLDPLTGELAEGVEAQADRAMRNPLRRARRRGCAWRDPPGRQRPGRGCRSTDRRRPAPR